MKTIAIGSVFRDSVGYLDRYFSQLAGLRELLEAGGARLRPVLVEGDSRDWTFNELERRTKGWEGAAVVKREHGGPKFGSVDNPTRWRQLAFACNGVLEALEPSDDALVYVESDLLWKPETMVRLLGHLFSTDVRVTLFSEAGIEMSGTTFSAVGAVAPFCFTAPHGLDGPRGFFYDTFGHVGADGGAFQTLPPHHPSAPRFDVTGFEPLVQIASAGSCIVATGERARAARFSEVDCIRGYCRTLGELYLDPGAEVRHPA